MKIFIEVINVDGGRLMIYWYGSCFDWNEI